MPGFGFSSGFATHRPLPQASVPVVPSTAGEPIGLLLLLTKAN